MSVAGAATWRETRRITVPSRLGGNGRPFDLPSRTGRPRTRCDRPEPRQDHAGRAHQQRGAAGDDWQRSTTDPGAYDYTSGIWIRRPTGPPRRVGKLSSSTMTMALWFGARAPKCSASRCADVYFSQPVGYAATTATTATLEAR